jgi:hypothetical protein
VPTVEQSEGGRPFRVHVDPVNDGSEEVSVVADRIRVESRAASASTTSSVRPRERRPPYIPTGEQTMNVTLPAPVEALIDAANRGDIEGFLDGFTPDGVVDDWGREFRGRSAIQSWSDREFIGVRVSLDVREVTGGPDEYTVTAQVGGDGFNGPSHFTCRMDGPLVSRMTIRA